MSLEFSLYPYYMCVNIIINQYHNKSILFSNNNNRAINFLNKIVKNDNFCILNDNKNRYGRNCSIIYNNTKFSFEIIIWSNIEKDIYTIPCSLKIINNIKLLLNQICKY
jgi:hypothetical protein